MARTSSGDSRAGNENGTVEGRIRPRRCQRAHILALSPKPDPILPLFHASRQPLLSHGCSFCRTPYLDNDVDELEMIQTQVVKKDPEAILLLGIKYCFGELGLQTDMRKAIELKVESHEVSGHHSQWEGRTCILLTGTSAWDMWVSAVPERIRLTCALKRVAKELQIAVKLNRGCRVWFGYCTL